MTIFDFILLVVLLTAGIKLVQIIIAAMDGHKRRRNTNLLQLAALLVFYTGTVVLVSVFTPQRKLHIAESLYGYDWGISVTDVNYSTSTGAQYKCTLELNLSSLRYRQTKRQLSMDIYLVDDRNHRYYPIPVEQTLPVQIPLKPDKTMSVKREFLLPKDAGNLGLVIEYGNLLDRFIIGHEHSLYHKKTIIQFS